MPWTVKDVDSHKKGLTPAQKKKWVSIANSVLKTCQSKGGSDCEGKAVRIANSKSTSNKSIDEIVEELSSLDSINFAYTARTSELSKLETETTEEGLLVKRVPVFKAGTYRGTEYSEDYIDRNFIGQFNEEEDVPIQADHSMSTFHTLGWVKNLTRKKKVMFADFLLSDDNAIARWKKKLMKKFSISVDSMKDKIKEISIVAFPYVKAAHVHSEDVEIENEPEKVEATEVNGNYFVTVEGEQFEIKRDENNFWFLFPIENRDAEGNIKQEEELNITDEEIDNIDLEEDVIDKDDTEGCHSDYAKWTTKYKNSLPDSSFLLVRRPVRDKSKDRALPVKDNDGKYSRSHVQNALARINQVKGFSPSLVDKAKAKLIRIAKKLGMETKYNKDNDMDKDKIKDYQGEGAEVVKEVMEQYTALEEKVNSMSDELKEAKEDNAKLKDELKAKKVDAKIQELKADGKITPAQEEQTRTFMLALDEDKIEEFATVISNGSKKVDLSEASNQGSDKEDADKVKAIDVDSLSASQLNDIAEEIAKDTGKDFNEVLDLIYDGKISTDKKLIV